MSNQEDKLRQVISKVLFDINNYPERAQKYIAGTSTQTLNDRLTKAILAEGFTVPEKPFCDECQGPYIELMEQYGGHWDTCPNRHAFEAPEGLCNFGGCTLTPHDRKVKHSWQL